MFSSLVKSRRDPLFSPGRKGGTPVLVQQLEYKPCACLCWCGLLCQAPSAMEQHFEK